MMFPKKKNNKEFLQDLFRWFEKHIIWFSQGWQVQAVTQLNQMEEWQIIFLHFYPTNFTGILKNKNIECLYSSRRTKFIQQEVSWEEIEESLNYLYLGSEEVRSVSFIKNTKLEKTKENRLDMKDHTLFHSNINSTPFIPYYSLNSQLDVSYDDSEIILTNEKLVFKSLKDAIIEVFLNFSAEMSSWISDNIQLPLFLMSIPLIPIKLNKISYNSRNFLINYSFQNFNQELSCGLTLMPYENKKYHFESDFEPDKDNIYSADFGTFFEFQIYQFNQHGIPDYLLLKGRMGVSEKDIRELDISKISSDDIIKLCKQGENKFVEFKDEKILNKEGRAHLLLEIEAFANTSSGLIIIGVGDLADNKGEILGIDESMKKRNKTKEELVMLIIENWIKELDPVPSIDGKCIDVNGTGHSVILLKIDYDESKTPITYNGKIVTRVYSSVNPASQSEIIRLTNRRSKSW